MNETAKKTSLISNLTLFFGGFLLFTDVFFLVMGIVYEMPLMRYVIYVKLVINTANFFSDTEKAFPDLNRDNIFGDPLVYGSGSYLCGHGGRIPAVCPRNACLYQL